MSLALILDREFRLLEQAGGGPFPTVMSQAAFLGLDKTYLSKLRNGATLTRARASHIAAKLRVDQSSGKTADLTEEIIQAGRRQGNSSGTLNSGAPSSEEQQFDELMDAADLADEHFIITATPAELEDSKLDHPVKLNKLLLRRLGIYPYFDDIPDTKYCFLLPSENQARNFWLELQRKAEASHHDLPDGSKVGKRLSTLNKDENKCLEVYVVPMFVCSCPIVVYNPAARFKPTKAFTFGYHENNNIDCVEWHDTSIKEWEQSFYRGFIRVESKEQANASMQKLISNKMEGASIWDTFFGYKYKYEQSQKPS